MFAGCLTLVYSAAATEMDGTRRGRLLVTASLADWVALKISSVCNSSSFDGVNARSV
jgi:hypothetical protein